MARPAAAARAVEPFPFDRVHGMIPGLTIDTGGLKAVTRSAARYLEAIGAAGP